MDFARNERQLGLHLAAAGVEPVHISTSWSVTRVIGDTQQILDALESFKLPHEVWRRADGAIAVGWEATMAIEDDHAPLSPVRRHRVADRRRS